MNAVVEPMHPDRTNQPVTDGAETSQSAVPRSNRAKKAGSSRGSNTKSAVASSISKAAAQGRLSNGQRLDSSRQKVAAPANTHTPAGSRPSSGSRRRLLTEVSQGSRDPVSRLPNQPTANAKAVARKSQAQVQQSSSSFKQQSNDTPPDLAVNVEVYQQQQQQDALSAAAAQRAATVASASSAASRLAQAHASVLEGLLLQRLELHTRDTDAAGHKHMMTTSIDTDTSALSLPGNGVNSSAAAAIAAGLSKQQLKQLLQKPWLLRASQEEVDSLQQRDPTDCARVGEEAGQSHPGQRHIADSRHEQAASDVCSVPSDDDSGSSSDTTMVDGEAQQQTSAYEDPCVPPQSQAVHGQQAGISSSNGSSWPNMKASMTAAAAAGSALQPPGGRPSAYKRPVARLRPRSQPVQMSTSLESAATLPVVLQQAPQSNSSQSSCLTTAGGGTLGEQQQAIVEMSCELVQQASVENIGSAIGRRKLGIAAATTQQVYTAAQHISQGLQQLVVRENDDVRTIQQQHVQTSHRGVSATGLLEVAADAAADSDADMSTTSEFACASVVSVATGCSTLSNMAAIDFVPRSHAKIRPPGVPKLALQGSTPANCSARARIMPQSPGNKSHVQLDDIAPLMAQKGTPRSKAAAAAGKAAGVQRSGGSFSSVAGSTGAKAVQPGALVPRAHSFTAGQGGRHSAAGAGSNTSAPSPAGSMQSRRAATVGGALPRLSSSSGGGGGTGHYWGSSAGSYPVSQEPSRLPTPITEGTEVPAHASDTAAVTEHGASPYGAAGGSAVTAIADSELASRAGPAAQQQPTTAMLSTAPGSTPRTHTGTFMTMRPVHLYKSVSTQFAMYSPLRGNLHALGQNKPSGSSSPGGYADGSESPGPSIVIGALGATAAVAECCLSKDVSRNGSEYQLHALLRTVPEEEGLVIDSMVGADGGGDDRNPATATAASRAGVEPGEDRSMSGRSASASSSTASPSPELVYATSLPTLEDFQRMVQQEQQQRELEQRQQQQQRQPRVSSDVVDRGPLFSPGCFSPEAAVRSSNSRPSGSRGSISHQRISLRRSTRTSTAAVPPPIDIDGPNTAAAAAVGPLTASSPSRKRSSAVLSGSSTALEPAPQHRRSREPSHQRVTGSNRASSGEPVECMAAALTAQTAVHAARLPKQHQQQYHQEEGAVQVAATCSMLSHADEESSVPAGAIGFEQPLMNSSKGGLRIRRRWQQHATADSSERLSVQLELQEGGRSNTRSNRRLLQAQQHEQQVPGCEQQHTRKPRTQQKRSSSKRSSRVGTLSSASPAAAVAGALLSDYRAQHSAELVTSYHNPLLMLEGLDEEAEAALIDAGMVPGLIPQGLSADSDWDVNDDKMAAAGSSGLLTACRSGVGVDNYLGVDAAAVPVHVTPLSKERSAGSVMGQDPSAVSAEQSAGGQLHWNPLYDPRALNGSPVKSY